MRLPFYIIMSSLIYALTVSAVSNAQSDSSAAYLEELEKMSKEIEASKKNAGKKLAEAEERMRKTSRVKGTRNRTHADIMQAWVGKKADDLASGSWGPPKSIYNNHDGTKLYTYADEWQTGYNAWENKSYWGTCTRKFNVDAQGIIQKWGVSGTCWELKQKVPNTPIPKSTL